MSARIETSDPVEIGELIEGRKITSFDTDGSGDGNYLVVTLDGPGSPTLYVDAPTLYRSPEATT